MSTRANIRIVSKKQNETLYLYHHHDGYPAGVGVTLKEYMNNRYGGNYSFMYPCDVANELIKGKFLEEEDDEFELTTCIHGDVEYVYDIDCDEKTLKCYGREYPKKMIECLTNEYEKEIPNN